jgi:hypothetical protein
LNRVNSRYENIREVIDFLYLDTHVEKSKKMPSKNIQPLKFLDAILVKNTLKCVDMDSPHAFIRGINTRYDKAIQLDALLRPLAESDDLRFSCGDGASERWVLMEGLPWDSEFFRYGVARLHAVVAPVAKTDPKSDSADNIYAIDATLDAARSRGIRYIFCTVPPSNLSMIRALSALQFVLIETRCYYHMRLDKPPLQRYATRLAAEADIPSLSKTAREMINPFDRFHADPSILPEDADRLMERWVRASIVEGFADATIVPAVDVPEAFCTVKYHMQHWQGWGVKLAQPVLSAVSTRHKGWYVRLMSELNEHLRNIGAEHAFLATQITNNAVIRCWEKLGYQFGKGEHVFRRLL